MKKCRVRLLMEVRSDLPEFFKPVMIAPMGEYPGLQNKHGAVSIILEDDRRLGVKPGEFVLIDDHEEDEFECMLQNDSIGGC